MRLVTKHSFFILYLLTESLQTREKAFMCCFPCSVKKSHLEKKTESHLNQVLVLVLSHMLYPSVISSILLNVTYSWLYFSVTRIISRAFMKHFTFYVVCFSLIEIIGSSFPHLLMFHWYYSHLFYFFQKLLTLLVY